MNKCIFSPTDTVQTNYSLFLRSQFGKSYFAASRRELTESVCRCTNHLETCEALKQQAAVCVCVCGGVRFVLEHMAPYSPLGTFAGSVIWL